MNLMRRFLIVLLLTLFVSSYAQKKADYKKFAGTITLIDNDVVKYDDELLIIYKTDHNIKKVFEVGILYPGLFKFPGITYRKTDAMSNVAHNFTVMGSNWINSKNGKIRLFRIILMQEGSKDRPYEYYFELVNPAATAKTNFATFLLGARLQSFRRGNPVL